MTREEILRQAVKEQSRLYQPPEWRAGFISGAKWADEHLNLYNDEKYHTVKVSCLDELNKKAVLYDEFLEKACEWLSIYYPNIDRMGIDEFITAFRQAMKGE